MQMAERKWTILNVPYGGGYGPLNLAKPKGARRAPKALQREFNRQSIFIADNGVSSWNKIIWHNIGVGLIRQNNNDGWERMNKRVFRRSVNLFGEDKNVLFLGGSHTITATTYPAVAQIRGRRQTGLIVLDAHPDCCRKANWPVHSDWLRWLVENECVFPKSVLVIGLRQIEPQEKNFLDRYGVTYYLMNSIRGVDNPVMNITSLKFHLDELRKLEAIYLSIDIDVVSGVYAPGTGCPSPGGFTDVELINLVKQLKVALPNLRAVDIVEINPLKWWQRLILPYDATVDLGVKLIKEIIS